MPQPPQLLRSRFVLTQRPPHDDPGGAHAHEPPMQLNVAGHATPQPPQLSGLVVMSTHAPPHRSVEPGQPHVPIVHATPEGQAMPQPPQFVRSVDVSTHAPPQVVRGGVHVVPPVHMLATHI